MSRFIADDLFAEAGIGDDDDDDGLFEGPDELADDDIAQEDAAEELEQEMARRRAEEKKQKKKKKEDLFGPSVDDIFSRTQENDDDRENSDIDVDEMLDRGRRKKSTGGGKRGGRRKFKMPPHMARLVGEANMAYAQQEYAKAVEFLLIVIKECPNAPEPFMTLGLIYEEWNQPAIAAEYLMIAAHMMVRDAVLWKRVATLWRDLHEDRRALFCYNKAIKYYDSKSGPSHDFDSMWQRIQLYRNLGESKRGTDAVAALLKLRPNDPDATKELVRMYHMSDQIEKAAQTLQEYFDRMRIAVQSRDPSAQLDLDIVNMLAEVNISMGKFEEASQVIQWAQTNFAASSPQQQFPLDLTVNYGLSQLFMGKSSLAQSILEKLLQESPDEYSDLYWAVSSAYSELGEFESALRFFLPLQTHEASNDSALWVLIARCYRSLNNRDRAIEFYEKAFEKLHDLESCCALTELYDETNELEKGIDLVKRFLDWRKQQADAAAANSTANAEQQAPAAPLPDITEADIVAMAKMGRFYYQLGQYETFLEIIKPVTIDPQFRFYRKKRRNRSMLDRDKATRLVPADAGDELEAIESPVAIPFALESSQTKNILEILGLDEYVQLFTSTVRALVWLKRVNEAHDLLRTCFFYIMTEDHNVPYVIQTYLRSLVAHIGVLAKDYHFADRQYRYLILRDLYNSHYWNGLFICSIKLVAHAVTSRYASRIVERHPDCVPARLIAAHYHHISRSHRVALAEYLPLYIKNPNSPTTTLSIGLSYLNSVMSRTNPDRNYSVMQAFAFLFRYGDLRGWNQEALYNLGRAFHQLNLLNFAIHMYERALNASPLKEKLYERLQTNLESEMSEDRMDVDESSTDANHDSEIEAIQYSDLTREIAYNLSLIYRRSGSPHLARMVISQHIII